MDDGNNDKSTEPSNLLLLRDLDHLSTEESIYKAMSPYEGVYRVLLYAMIAMEYINYYGLVVDTRTLSVTFGNPDSFIPVYGQSEFAISANTMEGFKAYRGSTSYVSQYSPAIEAEEKRRREELKRQQEEERVKQEKYKASLQNDVSAFFADMHDFDGGDENSEMFSVPKSK
ncbi:hypothetical protein G6F56_012500 [Rhizopus delemar]|nr:hypothetical protein G6F56_012500 [Rhizopus delemar]